MPVVKTPAFEEAVAPVIDKVVVDQSLDTESKISTMIATAVREADSMSTPVKSNRIHRVVSGVLFHELVVARDDGFLQKLEALRTTTYANKPDSRSAYAFYAPSQPEKTFYRTQREHNIGRRAIKQALAAYNVYSGAPNHTFFKAYGIVR